MAEALIEYSISSHAALEMDRRGHDEAVVRRVLASPEQRESVRLGRDVLQSRIEIDKRTYLVRVFVDIDRQPAEVVTAFAPAR